jgi:hypothetical protein
MNFVYPQQISAAIFLQQFSAANIRSKFQQQFSAANFRLSFRLNFRHPPQFS